MPKTKYPRETIEDLLCYANTHLMLPAADNIYVCNKLINKLGFSSNVMFESNDNYLPDEKEISKLKSPSELLEKLLNNSENLDKEALAGEIMDILMPSPSYVIDIFDQVACDKGIKEACLFLYDLSLKSNYICYDKVSSNPTWTAPAQKANLEIVIDVANMGVQSSENNLCSYCKENIGMYDKHDRHRSKLLLRTIPIFLNDEQWHFSYSPNRYWNEHFIATSDEHIPQKTDANALRRMLDFVDLFPHYFICADATYENLSSEQKTHACYQGGAAVMPLFRAGVKNRYSSPDFPDVRIVVPDWYCNVIRIESTNKNNLIAMFNVVCDAFLEYTNEKIDIIAATDRAHNSVALSLRINENKEYSLDIILRNDFANEAHPNGIFHTTPDLQNIYSKPLGVIETLGFFVLDGKLGSDAEMIKDFLTGNSALIELKDPNHPLSAHLGMIAQLVNDNGMNLGDEDAGFAIESYINKACERIISCAAIFKNNPEGEKAFNSLLKSMKLTPAI